VEAEDVQVYGRRAGQRRPRFGDRLHHHGGIGDAEACAAIGLRHGDAQPAIRRHGGMELVRKRAGGILLAPVGVAEALT
jgi:hypothetical protein